MPGGLNLCAAHQGNDVFDVKQRHQQTRTRSQHLGRYQHELQQQLAQANDMLRMLRRPAPVQRQGKVVSLPGAGRSHSAAD